MYGIWLGIPLGLLTFVLGADKLVPVFHDFFAGTATAIAAGLAVWFFCRGIDVLNDRNLDNPPSFDSHESIPVVLGKINEFLREAQFGSHTWQIRTLEPEETRIMATMRFQEIVAGVLPGTQSQLDRLILLNVYLEPTQEAKPETSTDTKPGTKIQLKWHVDSPIHRVQVNQIINNTTRLIQEHVGAKPIAVEQEAHPMMPPSWVLALLLCCVFYGMQKRDAWEKNELAQADARAKAQQEVQEQRQKIADQLNKLQQQQQQNGTGLSPNNPFAPQLTPNTQPYVPPPVQSDFPYSQRFAPAYQRNSSETQPTNTQVLDDDLKRIYARPGSASGQ